LNEKILLEDLMKIESRINKIIQINFSRQNVNKNSSLNIKNFILIFNEKKAHKRAILHRDYYFDFNESLQKKRIAIGNFFFLNIF